MADTVVTIDVVYDIEDTEYGPVYIATNDKIGLVTHGETFEVLQDNLQEALAACLEGVDTVTEYGIESNPRVEIRMVFPYGETA